MKIIFFGTPSFVIPVLESLRKTHDVLAVVTTPDEKVGRKQLLTPTPVKKAALSYHIPVFQPATLSELSNEIGPQLQVLHPDLFITAAYGKIIPKSVLDIPSLGALNIHPSRLPDYRGPSPIQETILQGQTTTAVTIIKIDEDVDHGPILRIEPLTIDISDTFETLAEKAFSLSAKILPETIEQYRDKVIIPIEQDHIKATFTKHVNKHDGYFDCNNPPASEVLDRMIRAYYPWPTVWTIVRFKTKDVRIKFLPEKKIQVEGKNPVSVKDFLNGYPEMKDLLNKFHL